MTRSIGTLGRFDGVRAIATIGRFGVDATTTPFLIRPTAVVSQVDTEIVLVIKV